MDNDLNAVLGGTGEPEQTQVVETQQAEVQEQPTGEAVSAAPAQQPEDPIETHRKGLETAVVAERRKRQEAEARNTAFEARIAELTKPAATTSADAPPDPAAYQDNPQEYWAKLARYETRQELKADRERQQQERQQQEQATHQQRFAQAATASVEAGRAEFTDFDAAVNSGLAPFLTPLMQQALISTKNGHKLAYHLAKNPGEAARISQLDPMSMLVELGELRSKVNAPQRQSIPQTLTQTRDSRGQFTPLQDGPTPLSAVLGRPS